MITNILINKSGIPESLKKNHNSWQDLQLMFSTNEDLLRVFYMLFCFWFCVSDQ